MVESNEWQELVRARLLERRTVLVSGDLDSAAATQAVAQLMTLDATGDGTIHLQLDCAGTSLDPAFSLMDTIDLLGVRVHVTCVGRVEGAAVGVLAVGHHRAATRHARILLRDPTESFEGRASELGGLVEQAILRLAQFHERIAQATRQAPETVAEDCRRGRYLGAEEALAYGLIDEIAERGASVVSFPSAGFGFRPPGRR